MLIALLINLLILLLIFGIIWYIIGMIPVPAQFRWIVNVIFAIILLLALIGLLTGGYSIYGGHALLR